MVVAMVVVVVVVVIMVVIVVVVVVVAASIAIWACIRVCEVHHLEDDISSGGRLRIKVTGSVTVVVVRIRTPAWATWDTDGAAAAAYQNRGWSWV